ncbi:MAG TPA: hypothetical protein VLQ46_08560 [Casimicrobiaceae bacterium]|nr:hypothetical protein [Casimicrobiaceae bacterium]
MDLGLWYGFWSGVLCGLWFGAGVTVLKLRQEAKQRGWRLPSADRTPIRQRAYGLAAMLAGTPLDQATDTYR